MVQNETAIGNLLYKFFDAGAVAMNKQDEGINCKGKGLTNSKSHEPNGRKSPALFAGQFDRVA